MLVNFKQAKAQDVYSNEADELVSRGKLQPIFVNNS